ncbi:hypothetical protein DV737_g3150, partial [Chaetothyriales sp. CBS 132003]
MSRVEELPDDFDESSVKINEAPPPTQGPKSLRELYDSRLDTPNALSDKSFEEIMFDMSKMPLFMDSKDAMAAAGEDENLVDAFRALQYEGTKAEVVQGFKDQGNEAVKEKRWKDAKEFYTNAIAVVTAKEGKWERPEDAAAEAQQLKVLEEQVYVNRALCNLELKNYRSTTLDCAAALRVNGQNVKAHYRSACALLALDKVHEALDVCYRGLKIDEANVALNKLLASIRARAAEMEKRDRRRRAEQKRKQAERDMLDKVLAARGVKLRGTARQPSLDDAVIRLSPDPLSATSLLEFPVMLLYPMHHQSDLIKAWAEKDDLSQHLSYILPTPWDDKQLYTLSSVDCYMDTITGGMMKVGKKLKLLEVLSNGKTEVVDGLVRIYVVPTSLAGQWINEVKQRKEQTKSPLAAPPAAAEAASGAPGPATLALGPFASAPWPAAAANDHTAGHYFSPFHAQAPPKPQTPPTRGPSKPVTPPPSTPSNSVMAQATPTSQSAHQAQAQMQIATPMAKAAALSPQSLQRERARVTVLLDINSALLKEVVSLQSQGKAGSTAGGQQSPTSPTSATNPGALSNSPAPSQEYADCMRRLQANLSYLAAIADAKKKVNGLLPVGPAIMIPPPHLKEVHPLYLKLNELFPEAGQSKINQAMAFASQQGKPSASIPAHG